MKQKDREFLEWIANRLVEVYGESPNVDFVLKLRQIACPHERVCVETNRVKAFIGPFFIPLYKRFVRAYCFKCRQGFSKKEFESLNTIESHVVLEEVIQ